MRAVTFVLLLTISGSCFAFECTDHSASEEDIETHIRKASDIVLGRVVAGQVDEALRFGNELTVTVRIEHAFKGSLSELVDLATGHDQLVQGIELGSDYVFFLYGNRELDSCGYLILVGTNVGSIDELIALNRYWSSRAPTRNSDALARLLKYFEK
jgi:hypothetical protein